MPKFILSLLILLLVLTACAPVVMPTATQIPTAPTAEESTLLQPESTDVLMQVTETTFTPSIPLESPLIPTGTPTEGTKLLPAVFDQAGYRQFAITRTYFPGLVDRLGEQTSMFGHQSFSPDGNLMALAGCWGAIDNFLNCETSSSGLLVIVDVNSGNLVADIPMDGAWPYDVDFSADSRYLLFSTKQQQVILWDISAQKVTAILNSVPKSTRRSYAPVAALPDGSGFVALIAKTLYVWDPSGTLLHEIPTQQATTNTHLAYSLDGSRLLTFSEGGTVVEVFDTAQWKLSNRIEANKVSSAALSPDGLIMAVLDPDDSSAGIWDLDKTEQIARVDLDGSMNVLQFNPKGDLLILTGLGNLETQDGYSRLGILVETQAWQKVDDLYSSASYGPLAFSRDGSRMIVFDAALTSLWELPDEELLEGLEVVRQFQLALATGDFATAVALFDATVYGAEYFASIGIDVNDLAGSFTQLCATGEIFCQPVRELVIMGHDWYDMVFMVRLQNKDGDVFTSPGGAQIITLTVEKDAAGKLLVTFPAMDY